MHYAPEYMSFKQTIFCDVFVWFKAIFNSHSLDDYIWIYEFFILCTQQPYTYRCYIIYLKGNECLFCILCNVYIPLCAV